MHLRTWTCLAGVLLLAGCQKEKEASQAAANAAKPAANAPASQPQANQPKPGDNKPILNVDAGQGAAMHFHRAKDIQALKGDMNQIAQFYIQYETENGRGPANWQEFKSYMGNDGARYTKEVESDKVAINYGVKPSSNTVIAYEKKADLNGLQVVVFGDKHVESLTPDKLKQALQNK
jgi:hypothetical protein